MDSPSNPSAQDILAQVPWPAYQFRRTAHGELVLEFVSPRAQELYELEPGEMSVAAFLGRVHPEDLPGVLDLIERSARGLDRGTFEMRIVLPGGRTRWIETSFTPRHEPDGSMVFHGVGHDVSDRKRMEADLRASQALTRQLIREMPLPIAMLDRELRYLVYSDAWLRAFGRGRGDLHGVGHYDVHPDLPARWREQHRRGLAGHGARAEEDPWELADGTTRWIRWEIQPWRDAAGEVGGIVIFAEDVTARRLAMDAELATERRYRVLVEMAPAAVFAHRDRTIVLANAAANHLFEAGPKGLVGRPVWVVIPEEIRATVEQRLARLEAGQSVPRNLTRLQTVGGRRIDVEVAATWVPDAQGGTILVVVRDLTDELRAQREQREGASRLSAILESMMDGVVTVDDAHRVVLANPAAEKMFGYGPGELLGRPLDDLVPPDRRAVHNAALQGFMREGTTARTMQAGTSTVLEALRADGSMFPTETTISKVVLGGRVLLTAIHRDIGPRLRMERALSAERERFEQLAEAIREAFWLVDAASETLLYVSPAYEAIWGRPRASALTSSHAWLEGVHPDDRARVLAAMPLRAQGRYDLEYRVVRPDGSIRWVHDRAVPVHAASGEVVRFAGVAEDVTARRSLEEQLRQAQRLESLALLAGGIAHDFNNLLTIVLSASEVLRAQATEDDRELIEDILAAGQRGATLTRQLLAFTRQEVVAPRTLRLASIVEDAERLLRRLLGEDIRIETRLAATAGLVHVDPGQWSQILLNLAINARDAMPSGGSLRIATRSLMSDDDFAARHPGVEPGRWEVLEVSDDGTGMPPEVRARIFEPFFTTKERGRGTGLGLAVVYGVVKQCAGAIEVDSTLGKGTTFTIYVPAATNRPSTVGVSRPDHAHGVERILVVEDEEPVRRVAVRALGAHGYDVRCAPDAATALRMVEESGLPSLLVTDVVMPGDDGVALAEQLRARSPGLRVLFTSGYIDDSLSRRGFDRTGVAFLQKPYSPHVLAARVREVLDG